MRKLIELKTALKAATTHAVGEYKGKQFKEIATNLLAQWDKYGSLTGPQQKFAKAIARTVPDNIIDARLLNKRALATAYTYCYCISNGRAVKILSLIHI